VLEAFFRDITPPRLNSSAALRKGIARGVAEGVFAYTSGAYPVLGPHGKFEVNLDKVVIGRQLAEDEVDFDSGFIMLPSALPEAPSIASGEILTSPTGEPPEMPGPFPGPPGGDETGGPMERQRSITLAFRATRDQVFKVFPAIANLADTSSGGCVDIRVQGISEEGYDPSWLRNAVEEPLDEADIRLLGDDSDEY